MGSHWLSILVEFVKLLASKFSCCGSEDLFPAGDTVATLFVGAIAVGAGLVGADVGLGPLLHAETEISAATAKVAYMLFL